MIKNILFSILLINMILTPCFAIDWHEFSSLRSKGYLDTDSIKKTDKYYFYNIKFTTNNNKDLVVTIQSALNSPFSARIRVYTTSEYENLNGDYENIQKNQTSQLEPVYYGSIVNSAYKYVKTLEMMKSNTLVIQDVQE